MQVYLILALIFALLVAAFAIQNTAVVTINFLFWEGSISLVLVILGSVAAGALLFFVLGVIKQFANNRERKELLKAKERLSADLAEANRQLEAAEAKLREVTRTKKELKADIAAKETAGTKGAAQAPLPGPAGADLPGQASAAQTSSRAAGQTSGQSGSQPPADFSGTVGAPDGTEQAPVERYSEGDCQKGEPAERPGGQPAEQAEAVSGETPSPVKAGGFGGIFAKLTGKE